MLSLLQIRFKSLQLLSKSSGEIIGFIPYFLCYEIPAVAPRFVHRTHLHEYDSCTSFDTLKERYALPTRISPYNSRFSRRERSDSIITKSPCQFPQSLLTCSAEMQDTMEDATLIPRREIFFLASDARLWNGKQCSHFFGRIRLIHTSLVSSLIRSISFSYSRKSGCSLAASWSSLCCSLFSSSALSLRVSLAILYKQTSEVANLLIRYSS